MVSQTITVLNAQGLHMRPAGTFSAAMVKYKCDVTIKHNGNNVNGKSLMNIIAACIKCGSSIDIICSGDDEQDALDEAVSLIENDLDEF